MWMPSKPNKRWNNVSPPILLSLPNYRCEAAHALLSFWANTQTPARVFTCRSHFTHGCWSIISTPSASLWLPCGQVISLFQLLGVPRVLLKRVKWEPAHASSRPHDRFVVVLCKCLQRNLASTLQQDRGNPSLDGVDRLPDRKITVAAEQLVVSSTPTKPERLQRDYGFKFHQTSSMSRHWAVRSRANSVVPLLWQRTQRCHPCFLHLLPFLNSAGVWGSHSSLLVVTEQVVSPLYA